MNKAVAIAVSFIIINAFFYLTISFIVFDLGWIMKLGTYHWIIRVLLYLSGIFILSAFTIAIKKEHNNLTF